MKRAAPLLLLAAAGCAAPRVAEHGAPVAAGTLGLSATPAPAVADRWWTAFGDPQLDRIVTDALAGNPTLDTAAARVAQAESVLETREGVNRFGAELDAREQRVRLSGRYTIPPPYAGSTQWVGEAAVNLNWNLDLFGRQRAAIRQAREAAAAARLDVAAARLQLAGSVVQTYCELARAERQLGVANRTLAAREDALRLTRVRIRNKLASDLDARAGETLVTEARQAAIRADARRVLAVHALAALAGRGADYYPTVAPTALRLDAALPLPAVLPADLLARRPDVAANLARVRAAEQGRESARRAYYPDINLAGLVGVQALGLGDLVSLGARTYGGGPALSLPLFDGGRRRADLEGAVAERDLAVAQYNDGVLGAVRDAADALSRIAATDADLARQRDLVRELSEVGRLNNVRVSSGLNSRLDLVDNDVRLLAAEQGEADLAVDAALRRVELVLALGGGFSESDTR